MTNKQRLAVYEHFFHKINLHVLTMNHEQIKEAISLIDSWSYAHRVGNGELSDYEQQRLIDNVIKRMEQF